MIDLDERINDILWPHPFSGEAIKPTQVFISNGFPPEGKTFNMTYAMTNTAIKALIRDVIAEVTPMGWGRIEYAQTDKEKQAQIKGAQYVIDELESKVKEIGL